MENRELLQRSREEIVSLRRENEKLRIRVDAIDDMLCLLHGKPGTKTSGGMAPDVVFELDLALKQTEAAKVQ